VRRRRTYTPGVLARDAELSISTRGDGEVVDLTERAQQVVDEAGARDGLCTVFVAHSTCGVTTIECEPGCNADVRAALLGPSVTVPIRDGRLAVGTWQRIVCVDFDDRPRTRTVVVQLLGD